MLIFHIIITIILNLLTTTPNYYETIAQPAPNNIDGIIMYATIAVSLKYLSNFWRSLEMSLIICKVQLKLKWTKDCVLAAAGNYITAANPDNNIFNIKDTKLYDPAVTLSAKCNQKLSKLRSKGFERSVYWN